VLFDFCEGSHATDSYRPIRCVQIPRQSFAQVSLSLKRMVLVYERSCSLSPARKATTSLVKSIPYHHNTVEGSGEYEPRPSSILSRVLILAYYFLTLYPRTLVIDIDRIFPQHNHLVPKRGVEPRSIFHDDTCLSSGALLLLLLLAVGG